MTTEAQRDRDPQGYSLISRIFHWVSAVAVLGLFALGYWMVDLGYYDPWYKTAPDIHKSVGILLLIVTIARLVYRKMKGTPKAIATHTTWEKRLAHAVHVALYLLLFTAMVAGYLISTADGRPISIFGLFDVPALGALIDNQEDVAGDIHWFLAWSIIVIVAAHAAAALKHHFIDKDATLRRMVMGNIK